MLAASGITVRVGSCPIVDRASLALAPGEFVALIGPNGAGKSTLIRALAGLVRHEGEVRLDGRLAGAIPAREQARLLAYLPQERQIEWGMSVREVVALGRHPFQRRFARQSAQDDAAIDAALAEVGLSGIAGRCASVLSGGEKARLLLARALAVGAPLLLADEPVSALDPFHQIGVMDILRRRADAGTGVLVVMQELGLAARFPDRVIVLQAGSIRCDGPPGAVLSPAVLEDVFGVTALTGQHAGQPWLIPWDRPANRPGSTG